MAKKNHFLSLSTGTSSAPPSAGVGPQPPQAALLGGDRYSALSELNNVFSSSAPNVSGYNTATTAQGWDYKETWPFSL